MKPEDVVIPDEALSERFLAATGLGAKCQQSGDRLSAAG